jgi:biopolymer transport protein ExbD
LEGETATVLFLDGSELGRGEEGFAALAGKLRHTTLKAGEIEAHPLVPHQEVIRAIDALMKVGIEKITFVGVPPPAKQEPRLALQVHLQSVKEHTVLVLHSGGGRTVLDLEEGLVALDAAISKLVEAGTKPAGLLEAPVYVDQDAVTRVLAVFRKHGIEDVTIIH